MSIFRKSKTERGKTSAELADNSLKSIDNDLSSLRTGVETGALRENVQEQSVMLAKIEQDLLPKYKSLSSWIKSTEWSRATKKQLKARLDENIENLEKMEDDLKKHNYTDLTTYKGRIWELEYYYTHYEQVRQIITLWWRTSDIHSIIDSKQDAKRARRYEKSDAKYQQSMNAILHDVALTSLWNNDMERYEEYLEAVVNWQIEPSSHPFYKAHEQSFRMIKCTNPSLYQIIAPSWRWRTWQPTWRYSYRKCADTKSESFSSRLWKWFGDVLSKVFPSIENNPKQKQAWEQAGSLLALWWAIYMWVKVIKNVFSKKETNPNKRWKALWWWAGLLALTNGDKIIKWWWQRIQDAFNRHPSEKIQATTELFEKYWFTNTDALKHSEMHVWAPVATMSALHFIPIYELNSRKIVEYKNNEFKFNYDNYKKYVEACDWTNEQKTVVLAAWQKLKEDNSLDLWLKALGVEDQNKLNSLANWSKTKTLAECEEIQTWWENCVEWISSGVNAELFKQWLKAKDLESAKKLIQEYNQNWWNKIKKEDMNKLIIKWMNDWLLEINDPDKKYEIEDMLKDPNIDLENKTIKWFTNSWGTPIEFTSYKELFNAANLTNWIKKNFKGRPAISENPFHIDFLEWRIEFDDTEWYKVWKNETDVVKMRTLLKNGTLWWNREFYKDFLNKRWNAEGKTNLDLTKYPMVKWLSEVWIQFTDEAEAQRTQQWLENIQDKMKNFAVWTDGYKPYSIDGNKLIFTTNDTTWTKIQLPDSAHFPWENRTIDNYPIIANNKTKFLEYMNNIDNHMRGKEVSTRI